MIDVPKGYKLFPEDPTLEMIEGFWGEIKHGAPELDAAKEAYKAMWDVVPEYVEDEYEH